MHRVAITYQKKLHSKITFDSRLTSVKGIGEKKAAKLLSYFKTVSAISESTPEKISSVAGISESTASELLQKLNQ